MIKQPTLLITGGAGYIGSHIGYAFAQLGYQIIVLDTFIYNQPFNPAWATIIKADYADQEVLKNIFTHYHIEAVIHCASLIEVGQSVIDPLNYYQNNVAKTIALLQAMVEHKVRNCIFSSSCAIYGNPQKLLLMEDHAKNPLSPYGKTKWMIEMILQDFQTAYGLEYVCLRYFNAAGAFPEQSLGEQHTPETHLIPRALYAALAQEPFTIFGDDYETKDGTAVRDYVHVRDIAQAHVLALQHLQKSKPSDCFNLGIGTGFSIKEILQTIEKICYTKMKMVVAKRRAGDAPTLVADPSKAEAILGWKPSYSQLDFIIKSAHAFEIQKNYFLSKKLDEKTSK